MASPKIGVIHYNWPGYDLEGFAARAVEIGFEYCDLMLPDIWDDESTDGEKSAEKTRKLLDKHGLKVSAVGSANDFLQADPAVLDAQIERYKSVCRLVPILGTDVVRTEGGWNREGLVPQDQWDTMLVDAFKRCADFLEPLNVRIALDNHGDATNNGEWQVSLIERVGSDRLGVNLDTMNYRWFGHDLETVDRYYEILAPHAFHIHLKDGTGSRRTYQGKVLGEGEIHLSHAVKCLKEAGYDGAWTVEYEGGDREGAAGFAKCYEWMCQNL